MLADAKGDAQLWTVIRRWTTNVKADIAVDPRDLATSFEDRLNGGGRDTSHFDTQLHECIHLEASALPESTTPLPAPEPAHGTDAGAFADAVENLTRPIEVAEVNAAKLKAKKKGPQSAVGSDYPTASSPPFRLRYWRSFLTAALRTARLRWTGFGRS